MTALANNYAGMTGEDGELVASHVLMIGVYEQNRTPFFDGPETWEPSVQQIRHRRSIEQIVKPYGLSALTAATSLRIRHMNHVRFGGDAENKKFFLLGLRLLRRMTPPTSAVELLGSLVR